MQFNFPRFFCSLGGLNVFSLKTTTTFRCFDKYSTITPFIRLWSSFNFPPENVGICWHSVHSSDEIWRTRNNANGKYLKAPLNAICGRNKELRTTNKLRIYTLSGLSVKSRTFYVHPAWFEWLWTDFCHGKRNLHPTPSVDETRNYVPRTPCWFRHF